MNGGAGEAFLPYLNLAQGLRMDYPASWVVREQASPANFVVGFGSPEESTVDQFQENLTITVQALFGGATLDAVVASWQEMMKQVPIQPVESGMTTLASVNAFRTVFKTPLGGMPGGGQISGKVLMFLFVIQNKGYTVAYTGQDGHFEVFLPVVNQMLATLQAH